MNAPKLRELLLLLLSASVSAAVEEGKAPEQAGCIGQATEKTLYLGVYVATDAAFRSCSPYKGEVLEDYLKAFVGGVGLYFLDMKSPALQIVYLGSRNLTSDEENKVIGSVKSVTETAVKGGDAMKHLMVLPLTSDDQDITPGNKLLLVLTRLNITEEETKNDVNQEMPIPGNSNSGESDEDYDVEGLEDRMVHARAVVENKRPKTVGGLSVYGSICVMAGAIVQDHGTNFSGVGAAAVQIANVLGPVYNGTIARRNCSEDDFAQQSFHGKECSGVNTQMHDTEKFECLEEEINGTKGEAMTPYEFYERHSEWTPCGTSYPGTQDCQKPEATTAYHHKACSISCCLNSNLRYLVASYDPIPAPDGEKCDSSKVRKVKSLFIKKDSICVY
uniref:Putative secreted metalloprotease n=1 Tax=Ixodes ricinus TaxID=34613 RepID=A0A6B0V9I4_IXORI